MDNTISSEQYTLLLGALAITIISIAVMGFILYKQRKKIKYLTTPRYGFMGKPLAVAAIMLVGFGTFGAIYLKPAETPDGISVTDQEDIRLEIEYEVIDDPLNLYNIMVTPYINNNAWGQENFEFNVSWEINKAGRTIMRQEMAISEENPGGIDEYLEVGLNTITARVSIGAITKTETIEILVN